MDTRKPITVVKTLGVKKQNSRKGWWPCRFCEKIFCFKHDLSTHIKVIHLGENVQCSHCGRFFSKKANLQSHISKRRCVINDHEHLNSKTLPYLRTQQTNYSLKEISMKSHHLDEEGWLKINGIQQTKGGVVQCVMKFNTGLKVQLEQGEDLGGKLEKLGHDLKQEKLGWEMKQEKLGLVMMQEKLGPEMKREKLGLELKQEKLDVNKVEVWLEMKQKEEEVNLDQVTDDRVYCVEPLWQELSEIELHPGKVLEDVVQWNNMQTEEQWDWAGPREGRLAQVSAECQTYLAEQLDDEMQMEPSQEELFRIESLQQEVDLRLAYEEL